jgi:hypothetical protein
MTYEVTFTPAEVKKFVSNAVIRTAIKTFLITSIGTFILTYMLFSIIHM